jgi:hypothetical protein
MLDDQHYTVITKPGFGLTVLRAEALAAVKLGMVSACRGQGVKVGLWLGSTIKKQITAQRFERARAAAIAAAKDRAVRIPSGKISKERLAILLALKDARDGMTAVQLGRMLMKEHSAVANLLRFMGKDGPLVNPPARHGGPWTISAVGLAALS